MSTPHLDGSLASWPDLAPSYSESVLLCGNGLSVNVWPEFAYASLFDYAREGGLTEQDLALLATPRTSSASLAISNTAIRVNEALGQSANAASQGPVSVTFAALDGVGGADCTYTELTSSSRGRRRSPTATEAQARP
jgi:hypothetical protein